MSGLRRARVEMRNMRDQLFRMAVIVRGLITGEEGQDLIEYGLLITLIALATITGEAKMASAVTTLYSNIGTSLN